jgi:hypothetical protein
MGDQSENAKPEYNVFNSRRAMRSTFNLWQYKGKTLKGV